MSHNLLHLADIHLDAPFPCFSAGVRERLRKAHRDSFESAITFAIEQQVAAVLIAGDLYEAETLSWDTERFIIEQFNRLYASQIPCIYVAGDADPSGAPGYGKRIAWPEGCLYIGDHQPQVVELQDTEGELIMRVVGAGHVRGGETKDLSEAFPKAEDDCPYIGLMHSTVSPSQIGQGYKPISPTSLRSLKKMGYTYWALGHIHERQQVGKKNEGWYPGAFFGRHYRDAGPQGGLLVSIDKNEEPRVTFKSFARAQWIHLEIKDSRKIEDFYTLVQHVEPLLASTLDGRGAATTWLLHVEIRGMTPFAPSLTDPKRKREIEERLADRLHVEYVDIDSDGLTLPTRVSTFTEEPHVLGELLNQLEQAHIEESLLELPPEKALAHHETDEKARRTYRLKLLESLDREAVLKLYKGDSHAY